MGEDWWFFIEEASYKLLIETIIEGQQEGRAGRDDGSGSGEKSGSLEEMCDKEERCQEQKCLPVEIDAEKSPSKNSQTHHHFISKVMPFFFHLFSNFADFLIRALGREIDSDCKDS